MRLMVQLVIALSVAGYSGIGLAEDKFFDSDGVRIRYIEEGSGEPVVLIHGLGGRAETWKSSGMFQKLAKNYRVIAMDCRGHGKSDKPLDPKLYGRNMTLDIARPLDHLEIERDSFRWVRRSSRPRQETAIREVLALASPSSTSAPYPAKPKDGPDPATGAPPGPPADAIFLGRYPTIEGGGPGTGPAFLPNGEPRQGGAPIAFASSAAPAESSELVLSKRFSGRLAKDAPTAG